MRRELARQSTTGWQQVVPVAAAVLLMAGCGMMEDEPHQAFNLEEDTRVQVQELNSFCSVQVRGYGAVDVESDYLPSVVACENGNAPLEALKAQAVAARTYAMFISEAENRALFPTTDDQVYDCDYAEVEERHIQAVEETAGQVLTYGDDLVAGFYVAGAEPSGAECQAQSGDPDSTNTEQYVTYNKGRTGDSVHASSLGHPDNPANRGAKSQNGARCMADSGWTYDQILRAYYGDDIRARVAEDSQCGGPAPDGGDPPPADSGTSTTDNVCNIAPATASDTPSCTDPDQEPRIEPRSAWGARTTSSNWGPHSPNRITVHHTVTPNNEAANAPSRLRQIQNDHIGLGYRDIGYHFLIGWDGTIYRGTPEQLMGAHTRADNPDNLGIALLGSFHQSTAPSDAQIQSLRQMLRHLGDKYDIDLSRDRVKGHQEWPGQSTQCPGGQLLSQLDQIVDSARADTNCADVNDGGDGGGGDVEGYRYVRVSGVSNTPAGDNDTVEGFEVDAIHLEKDGDFVPAHSVKCSPGVTNGQAALGEPDNDSCDNRGQTVAGVSEGSDLVIELRSPAEIGDVLHVTQASYNPAMAECEPSGTAKVMVSNDGATWKVLDANVQGNWTRTLDDGDFVFDGESDEVDSDTGFEFINPTAGEAFTPDMTFKVMTSHPEIVEVEYFVPADAEDVINDDWTIGTSSSQGSNYEVSYEIQDLGERVIAARGLDAQGNEVARQEISITVTDFDGSIPEGESQDTDLGGGSNYDSSLGDQLAQEGGKCYDPSSGGARCQGGSGGYSTGHCWRFVKRALERAGISWALLDSTGPCSTYRFHLSAYGFRCNADANPGRLSEMGFERVSMAPSEAPAGAIISWDRGCRGYNADHGHIEISMGNGQACSDYCGTIRSGGQSCSSVYVPTN